MAKYLVIVESPAKVKTIKKFLGPNYEVAASNGHVRDLPKSQLGIDVEHDYEPKYITIRGKGDILANLRKEVKKAEKVYLATDPDREGEAISWHLTNALNLEKNGKKIAFYNTHLSYEDMELRTQQMQTLKEALDNDSCEYKIIVGDFNATQSTKEFDLFKDEYSISNGKDGKWLDTFNGTDDTMNVNSVDNVIVSKNITINKVQMLDSKLSDHNPMVVELTLN